MSNLTKNYEMRRKAVNYDRRIKRPAKAGVKYYRGGAAVVIEGTDDVLRKPAAAAGERFVGIVDEYFDNTLSAVDAQDENGAPAYVDVLQDMLISPTFDVAPTSADIKKWYYWTDDNNVTLTAGTNCRAGRLDHIDREGRGWIDILPATETIRRTAGEKYTAMIPFNYADLVNTSVLKLAIPHAFTLLSYSVRTAKPVTTAAKAASLQAQVSGAACTGGVAALTSANSTPMGAKVDATAITAGGSGASGGTIEFAQSGVTTFVEGNGYIEAVIRNDE